MVRTLTFNTRPEAQRFAKMNNGEYKGIQNGLHTTEYDDENLPDVTMDDKLSAAFKSLDDSQKKELLAAIKGIGQPKPAVAAGAAK